MSRPRPLAVGRPVSRETLLSWDQTAESEETARAAHHQQLVARGHTLSCASAMATDGRRCRCRAGRRRGGAR